MSAQGLGVFTIEFPDPYQLQYYNDKFITLTPNISFRYPITSNIQTLSSKSVESGNDPYGILYVPALHSSDCIDAEKSFVATNATRINNLPAGTDYSLIAVAPWFSATCMLEYFQSARTAPVKAFLTYLPGNTSDTPPAINSPSWGLDDGGSWKSANHFPAYALPSAAGGIIMHQLSLYSGNLTDAPYGHDLAAQYSPTDYVRLWADVDVGSPNNLPSLWVFLVIVLGLLIFIITATSLVMHLIMRRRRDNLRRRVINGEVNLESVGVKRLTVPREYVEKLPLYTYAGPSGSDLEKAMPQPPEAVHSGPDTAIEAEIGMKSAAVKERRSSAPVAPPCPSPISFSQPTCPICLDDFETGVTQVRELPCRHIFHPDCVDTFLLSNSSLCPMCKHSVLPTGYCPARITNVMVRRERMLRRMRARSMANAQARDQDHNAAEPQVAPLGRTPFARMPGSIGSRLNGAIANRRIFSAPERMRNPTRSRPPDIEMGAGAEEPPPPTTTTTIPTSTPEEGIATAPNPAVAEQQESIHQNHQRREWARQRALAMLGRNRAPTEDGTEEHGSRWRRAARTVFPGFR